MAGPNPHLVVALFHIFAVVPFLLYVAIQRTSIPVWVYWLLFAIGLLITIYHGAKAVLKYLEKLPSVWVNIIHAVYLGPLLIYMGWKKYDTPRAAYEILALFGFAALGYHFLTVVNLVQEGAALVK